MMYENQYPPVDINVKKVLLDMDLSSEISFKTARSGGKGGQNVNKVETMVEGYWHVANSNLITDEQKVRIATKLAAKINAEGFLLVKSQEERTQLGNKAIVLQKIHNLVAKSLIVQKKRKPTQPGKAAKEKRLDNKKKNSAIKQNRMRVSL